METVVLTIHLILALLLIGVVLLQRNEGGALLSGGGSMSARGAANALTKLTWGLAVLFILTSITLTVLAAREAGNASVVDQLGGTATPDAADGTPEIPAAPEGNLLPPPADAPASAAPAAPPASD
jgi:preprotein translocase subunit SecG